ncbi:MAG: hypothetical protein H6Q72_4120 [Firmicutes bacterium]|nr:hypothetical protein [Bacillota bacterium]
MCDPTAIAAVGSAAQGYAGQQSYKAQAQIANNNAVLANAQANQVEEVKQQQQHDIRAKESQVQGAQRAALAANGSDTSSGSGLAAITDTAVNAQEDINRTDTNAQTEEWGYRAEATNYRNQASVYNSAATSSMLGGVLGATGQYLAGQGTVSDTAKSKVATGASGVSPNIDWLGKNTKVKRWF